MGKMTKISRERQNKFKGETKNSRERQKIQGRDKKFKGETKNSRESWVQSTCGGKNKNKNIIKRSKRYDDGRFTAPVEGKKNADRDTNTDTNIQPDTDIRPTHTDTDRRRLRHRNWTDRHTHTHRAGKKKGGEKDEKINRQADTRLRTARRTSRSSGAICFPKKI